MTTYFAEILAIEAAALAQVIDGESMVCWRRRVVEELMSADSRYASAMRLAVDGDTGREFLATWRDLLTSAVERVLRSKPAPTPTCATDIAANNRLDAERLAVLILAALHGGGTLSRVADDPAPLDAALDLALAPLTTIAGGDDPDPPAIHREVT